MTIAHFNSVVRLLENSDKCVDLDDVAELLHDLLHETQMYIPDACIGVVSDKFTECLRGIEARGE
jgi:hypothetical protein